ncbi:hypothetical protein GUT183_07400 [Streptococcus ruminantium]|nr:hypothetical protein GUT183_07400 [Streptococcus ruminantium]
MIRQSDLPFKTIKELYEQEFDLNELFIQEEYEEIVNKLLLVSPSLVTKSKEDIVNLGELSSRSRLSLIKYLIRMSSRTSTFQSLSKVSDTEIKNDFIAISVSIKWLRDLKEKVEKLQDRSSTMPFILSKHIRISELYYSSDYYCEEELKQKNVKIAATSTLGKILHWISESSQVSYYDLFVFVLNLVGQHEELAKHLLDNLIKHRYITSTITISSLSPEKSVLLSEIAEFSPSKIKNKLYDIVFDLHNLMEVEDFSEINITKINSLSTRMSEISERNPPLVIDSYYKNTSKNQIYDVEKIREILGKLRSFAVLTYDHQYIEVFKKIFIEEFGMFNEVPLDLIFINPKFEEKRIYKLVQNDTNLQKRRADFDQKVARLISDAIVENRSIHLDELTSMVDDTKNEKIKVSVDARVRKFGNTVYLPPSSIAFPAGSYSAKYKYLSHSSNLVKPYYVMDYLLNYVPDIGINYIDTRDENMICVDSIGDLKKFYIAMDRDGLYIRNCSDRKKVLPVFQSLAKLDFINESYIARCLQRYTNAQVAPPLHFLTEKYESFPYIPRIVHDGIVIFKESWNLSCEFKEDENILRYLCDFIEKYKIPEYVAIFEKGDEFPVSTTKELGLKIITQELKKKKSITLVEYPELNHGGCLEEFISPYTIGDKDFKDDILEVKRSDSEKTSDYITYILLLSDYSVETLLLEINNFAKIDNLRFFFVRYIEDEKASIRLRFLFESLEMEHKIWHFFNTLFLKKKINSFYKAEYIPEFHRYGKKGEIAKAEQIFELDSEFAIANFGTNISPEHHAIYLILATLLGNYGNFEECFNFFERNFLEEKFSKKIRKKYTKNRDSYNNVYFQVNDKIQYPNNINKELSEYLSLIKVEYPQPISDYMVLSLIHMRINRSIGIIDEKEFYYLSKYIISRMFKQSKYRE